MTTSSSSGPVTAAPPGVRSLANPRRTTWALRAGTACGIVGPDCRGTASRLLVAPEGSVPACSTCAPR